MGHAPDSMTGANRQEYICEKVMYNGNQIETFPAIENMLEGFIDKSFIIETNSFGDCYLIKKQDLIDIFKKMTYNIVAYNQKFTKDTKNFY